MEQALIVGKSLSNGDITILKVGVKDKLAQEIDLYTCILKLLMEVKLIEVDESVADINNRTLKELSDYLSKYFD